MKKKNVVYILLIVLALGLYFYQSEDTVPIELQSIDLSTEPIYQSDRMETFIYNPSGGLSYQILADNVRYFENSGDTLFKAPKITLYNQESLVTWHISAKDATLTHDKLLLLRNDVILKNVFPNSQIQNITTSYAKVDLKTLVVTSSNIVTIEGMNFTSTGTGLLGNLHDKTADILENVKTYYTPHNTQTDNTTN